MISTNFEFLRPVWPELAGLGGFAESYARPDPVAALVKLRNFGELLADLEAARAVAQAAEADAAELRAAQEHALAAGTQAADTLHFSEEATRRHLVDVMLAEARWHVGDGGASTEEVRQEVEVHHQP